MKGKLLLKAMPLVLLVLSAAIHTCACPYEPDQHEGPGPAERARLGAAKRKRPKVMARITRLMVMNVIELIFTRVTRAIQRMERCDAYFIESCGHPK